MKLTIRRLLVWNIEPQQRMKLLGNICFSCNGLKGGQLINSIAKYSNHGDPLVVNYINHVLSKITVPIFDMLSTWLLQGQIIRMK